MTSECAPGAQDFAPPEAVPEGKVLWISAAGQDDCLDGIAVVAVAEVGAVLLVRAAFVVEVLLERRDDDELVLGSGCHDLIGDSEGGKLTLFTCNHSLAVDVEFLAGAGSASRHETAVLRSGKVEAGVEDLEDDHTVGLGGPQHLLHQVSHGHRFLPL